MIRKDFIFENKKCRILLDKKNFLEGELLSTIIIGIKSKDIKIILLNNNEIELLNLKPCSNIKNILSINEKLLFNIDNRYNLTNTLFIKLESTKDEVILNIPLNLSISNKEKGLIKELEKLDFIKEEDYFIYKPNKYKQIFKKDNNINNIKLYYLINNSFIYLYTNITLDNREYNKNFIYKKNSTLNQLNNYMETI